MGNSFVISMHKLTPRGSATYSQIICKCMKRKAKSQSMKRTPPEISRRLQEIRQKADIWRAGVARARAEGNPEGVTFGMAEVALLAKEVKMLLREAKKQF